MPMYFFHTEDGGSQTDVEGIELVDQRAAMSEAVTMMGQMLKDAPKDILGWKGLTLIVTGAAGQTLFVLDLSAVALPPVRPAPLPT